MTGTTNLTRYSYSGMDRNALELRAMHLQGEVDLLRNELAVLRRALADLTEHVFDAAQSAAHAAQLGRMLTDDQGEPEE